MRRYLQGSLDFYCGIYCVINALSCLFPFNLSQARYIFSETILSFSSEELFQSLLYNNTDHYWVVRYMLCRWALDGRYQLHMEQPFEPKWVSPLGTSPEEILTSSKSYLPESEPETELKKQTYNQELVWNSLYIWFHSSNGFQKKASAVLRFFRYMPENLVPVVMHWSTVKGINEHSILLHDASGEKNALFSLEKSDIFPLDSSKATVRIVPESLVLLRR